MMLMRRLCLLVAIMFWQGGFMFYGAVVVPIGSEILGSHQTQGFVTRSVTNYLNMAGLVALGFLLWDLASRDTAVARHRLRWALWLVLLLTLGLLGWFHVSMDQCLDIEAQQIRQASLKISTHVLSQHQHDSMGGKPDAGCINFVDLAF